jgi:hypothetical protein
MHVLFGQCLRALRASALTTAFSHSQINSRDVHFMATTRAEKSRDAIILVKLTKKLGILRPRKVGADAREKLRNNALDTAFGEYLQCMSHSEPKTRLNASLRDLFAALPSRGSRRRLLPRGGREVPLPGGAHSRAPLPQDERRRPLIGQNARLLRIHC